MRATVLDVLAERRAHGSTPGARNDDHRVALVIEGGGSRAAYSTGMIGVVHEHGLADCFDAVYGSSAGALNGAWLLCGRAPEAMAGWTAPGVMRRVMDSRRVVRGRPVVDLDYPDQRALHPPAADRFRRGAGQSGQPAPARHRRGGRPHRRSGHDDPGRRHAEGCSPGHLLPARDGRPAGRARRGPTIPGRRRRRTRPDPHRARRRSHPRPGAAHPAPRRTVGTSGCAGRPGDEPVVPEARARCASGLGLASRANTGRPSDFWPTCPPCCRSVLRSVRPRCRGSRPIRRCSGRRWRSAMRPRPSCSSRPAPRTREKAARHRTSPPGCLVVPSGDGLNRRGRVSPALSGHRGRPHYSARTAKVCA